MGCAWGNAKWVGYDGELASFPLIATAGAISVKQQRCLGGQKTEAGSAAVNAHFRGIEFKSWALVPMGFAFHVAEMLSFGIVGTWVNCFLLSWKGSTCGVLWWGQQCWGTHPACRLVLLWCFWQNANPERLRRNVCIFDFQPLDFSAVKSFLWYKNRYSFRKITKALDLSSPLKA